MSKIFIIYISFVSFLFGCDISNLSDLEFIKKDSSLISCSTRGDNLKDINTELENVEITIKELLVTMNKEKDFISKEIQNIEELANVLREMTKVNDIREEHDNILNHHNEMTKSLKETEQVINNSTKSLINVRDEILHTYCILNKRYKFVLTMLKSNDLTLQAKENFNAMKKDLKNKCSYLFKIVNDIDSFFISFEATKKMIKKVEIELFSVGGAVTTFIRSPECNNKSCVWNKYNLLTIIKLKQKYNNFLTILEEITKRYEDEKN